MRSKCGFTLVEAIVTLAIVAVVGAIAVPTAMNSTAKANASVCIQTQQALLNQYKLRRAMSPQLTDASALLGIAQKVTVRADGTAYGSGGTQYVGLCPDGGVYTLRINNDGSLSISCSVEGHSKDTYVGVYTHVNGLMRDPSSNLGAYLSGLNRPQGSSIDATAPSRSDDSAFAGMTNAVIAKASADGFQIQNGMWRIYSWGKDAEGRTRYTLYYTPDYTPEQFNRLTVGAQFTVYAWTTEGSAEGKIYTGTARVVNGPSYSSSPYLTIEALTTSSGKLTEYTGDISQ